MTQHKCMLAHNYEGETPENFYISEKLDGMRAIYDGPTNSLISRNGNKFNAPSWFTKDFPKNMILDGELYTKRGDFDNISSIIRKKQPIDHEWREVTYMVFDILTLDTTFEERYALMNYFLVNIPHLHVVEHTKVKNAKHMNDLHKLWISQGGEGSMLRIIDSKYEYKRSRNLLKLKEFFNEEAVVDEIEMGKGKYKGVMGSLIVHWLDPKMKKVTFNVGSGFSDKDRQNYKKMFPKGTIIRLKFWEINKSGRPRFPIYEGIRDIRDL